MIGDIPLKGGGGGELSGIKDRKGTQGETGECKDVAEFGQHGREGNWLVT